MKRILPLLVLSGLLAVVLPSPVSAANISDEYPWLKINPKIGNPIDDVEPALVSILEERLQQLIEKGFGAVDLLVRIQLELTADGSVVERVTKIRRFLLQQGVRATRDMEVWVQDSRETIEIERAYVVSPQKKITALEPEFIQVLNSPSPSIYSDARKLVLPMTNLQEGATTVLVTRKVFSVSEWPLPWSESYFLHSANPRERFEVTVEWADGVSVPVWATAVRRWVQQAEIDSGKGPAEALTSAEREELAVLA